ncbi:MAG: BMP family ABC transporter substrate-binding protein [Thermoflexaceae bacterium]|nr:BMP family ABC transporter substrate-binding protein [Thermoflexaceae bacterium]
MRKYKRLLAVMAALVTVFAVSGCSQNADLDDYATNKGYQNVSDTDGNTKETALVSDGIPKDEIKVGVIHLTDPAEGSGYTYTHDLGIQGMQENLGLRDDQIIRKINVPDTDDAAVSKALQECVDEGCNIIFTTSWGYMQLTSDFAEKYPDIYFSHGTGYLSNGKNFNNYFGRIYQPRYLSGIAAGLKTQSNKIGYVAAQDNTSSEVTGGIDAFAMGVYSVNPDAVIYVKVTYSWFDPEGEAAAANELLDMGCDVLAQHCDTSFPSTLAEERGVWSVGYNSDMSKEAPGAVLCSVIWNWSAYYTSAVQSVIDGTWNGSNYYGGMAEGLVQLTSLSGLNAPEAQEKIDEASAAIISGKFNVFDGKIETNEGKIIGTEGKTLDDATITGGIDWYFKNVVVVE